MNPSLTVTFPPLHEAALNGHVHCLEMLMQMGADLEKSENQFGTALHIACLRGYVECVRTLLHAGANPNVIKRHQSPLHTAALCGYEDCTLLLIEYGANVYQRNLESKRPADLATDTVCRKILQAKAGEKVKPLGYSHKKQTAWMHVDSLRCPLQMFGLNYGVSGKTPII